MWRLKPSEILPDENAIRAMIKPEEVSLLDAMQLGIKELEDAGYDPRNANIDDDVMDMDAEEDDEDEGGSKAPKGAKKPGEKQEETLADKMAPWKTTKAFIDACAQKAMLQLHGEGDPTGHGLGFSFIRTSMKGGYIEAVQGPLATSADAMEREKRANGGHAYNVKKQQAMYEEGIKEIWEKQKATLSDAREHDDKDVAVTEDEDDRFNVHAAATPAQFDDGTSQISGFTSASRHVKKAIRITREVRLQDGSTQTRTEVVHDPVVISQYMKRRTEADLELKEYVLKTMRCRPRGEAPRVWKRLPSRVRALHKWACLGHTHLGPKRRQVPSPGAVADYVGLELRAPAYVYLSTASTAPGLRAMPTMTALRALARCRIKKELERLEKNKARRQAREQQKELHQKASAGEAGSPGAIDKLPTGTTRNPSPSYGRALTRRRPSSFDIFVYRVPGIRHLPPKCPAGHPFHPPTAAESVEKHAVPSLTDSTFPGHRETTAYDKMVPDADKAAATTSASAKHGNQLDTDTMPSCASHSASDTESRRLERVKLSDAHRRRSSNASQRLNVNDAHENLHHCVTPDVETEAERMAREPITYTKTGASIGSTASRPPEYEVYFEEDDAENPRNWPLWYRCWCVFCVSFATWVATMYSTSYTSSSPGLIQEFGSTTTVVALGMTTYLVGLAAGSLVLAPLSELYGRQVIYVACLCLWAMLIVPCGLARSLNTIIVVRLIGAFFGAVMICNAPGSVVDVSNPDYFSRSMSLFGVAPLNGPVTGPIVGGFVFQYLGWRWDNWIVLVMAGLAIALMCTVRETYAPKILQRKAARMREQTDDPRYWCQYDRKVSTLCLLKVNLSRPFILFATEPILWFMNLWISIVYGILYLCFVAYPAVFSQHRGWGAGISGLAFCGIGIGTLTAVAAEPLFRRIINSQARDPETGKPYPEAQASIMAIGAVCTAVGQLGFSWTCLPTTIHWAAPIAFGIPFGCGNTISFIYGCNYLAGAYGIYAASALAGNVVIRSVIGGTLPLAGAQMYRVLGAQWAGTLLGLLEVAIIPIPIVFWRYGGKIRGKSRVIRQLREDQEKLDEKRATDAARAGSRRAARLVPAG
ncbi:MFS multidrug transporter [Metarhizium album ARSEF 1941]|uniref:MFS multidrug transporter n=1 Tax=Metarhizium album (strain ARSEF 1941) TaxID=1081103 RepID=A0A0B2X6F5_METAS|nr:MFS multidrug transporter [Metarhizium album ARSEF 1941]KHO01055.1 MFS multidrug transporter [Metarhizium album ARSEF 1941]